MTKDRAYPKISFSHLGAAPVAAVALPALRLGIMRSRAVVTTTFASVSFVASGGFIIATVLSTVLAATITLMGFSLGWFHSSINPPGLASVSTVEAQPFLAVEPPAPLPLVPPGSGANVPVKPFIIVVKTDQTKDAEGSRKRMRPSDSNQFTLPLSPHYAYDFTINWGDGTTEVMSRAEGGRKNGDLLITHTYAQEGKYTIQITENVLGGFPALYFNDEGDASKLLEISQWGGGTWRSMTLAFQGCENLSITAADAATALTGNVSSFRYAWEGCAGLTNFPLLNTAAGTDFSSAWADCPGLTNFPLLNTAAGTNFEYTWARCTGLTNFPLLNTAAGTNFRGAWFHCTGLTTFPLLNTAAGTGFNWAWTGCTGLTTFPLLNTAAGTDFGWAWNGCTGLTNFPLLNTSAGKTFYGAWGGCSGLTSFPLLNTSAGTSFGGDVDKGGAWYGCSGLTSFPLLDTSAGTSFGGASHKGGAWYGCSGLTSFPLLNISAGTDFTQAWSGCSGLTNFPLLDFGKMEKAVDCFTGVTITSASYDKLLANIAVLNKVKNVTFDGGFSKASGQSGIQAREKLMKKLGWTIYDGDHPKPAPQEETPAEPQPKPESVNDF
jgi:hypothetical protein